jgi:aryl-alcohol dehydrogenase-like predicted oxidoreductase
MQYSIFPSLEVPVSRLGFGAFGLAGVFGPFDELAAIETMHHCWDAGVNFLDTARLYGESERIIGEALSSYRGTPPFIATKARAIGPITQWAIPPTVEDCFPQGHITAEVDASLRLLGVDTIDLLQMHLYWPNWGVEGYWLDELERLREAGKIRAIGISLPDQRHDVGLPLVLSGRIDCVQTVFNIFDPLPLDCLVPLCQRVGVAVIARCVLDEGGLTGSLSMGAQFGPGDYRAKYFDQGPREEYLRRVNALRGFVPQEARSLASLALRFVLHHPGVTTAVSSMHVREHAEANIAALDEPPLSDSAFTLLRHRHRWIRNFYGAKVL